MRTRYSGCLALTFLMAANLHEAASQQTRVEQADTHAKVEYLWTANPTVYPVADELPALGSSEIIPHQPLPEAPPPVSAVDDPSAPTANDLPAPGPHESSIIAPIEEKSVQPGPTTTDDYDPDVKLFYDNTGVSFNSLDLLAGYQALHHGILRQAPKQNLDEVFNPLEERPGSQEHYQWGGLIVQSLLFNLVENSFRIASDDQIRALLRHKPFWHDWAASMRQFNMRRWNDGDDFLVNYVGHPMQGAVSGFIEIQNDPVGRQQEISATRDYWMSRVKALMWATVYSTHSEISPLGEAGIGNEGGWTYPLNCKGRCTEPGSYTKYTNNTGWVDFIVTPTIGTLWLLSEDAIDRYVSDRVQGGDRSHLFPKIVRGTLNPSRTMANALRGKAPWYRDFQNDPELEKAYGVHFLPPDEQVAAPRLHRFELMPYFVALPIGTTEHHCAGCLENPGVGFETDVLFKSWIGASFAASRQNEPFEKTVQAEGWAGSWSLGMLLRHQLQHNTLSLALRTGLQQDSLVMPSSFGQLNSFYFANPEQMQKSRVSHVANSVMFSNDFNISRYVALRSSFGDTLVRYRTVPDEPKGIGKPPYLSWLSHDNFVNKSVWTSQIGPVVSF